jgi:hypothetical protein
LGPSLTGVDRAAALFQDPDVRAQAKAWHLEEMPLMEMVDRLGLSALFAPELRAAVAGLSPEEVTIIRQAFIATIDAAGQATEVEIPVDCDIKTLVGAVDVTAGEDKGRPIAVVKPAK